MTNNLYHKCYLIYEKPTNKIKCMIQSFISPFLLIALSHEITLQINLDSDFDQ